MDWNTILQFSEAAISIFALINPIGGLPALVGLTEDMDVAHRRKLLRIAGVTALGVIVAMALVGQVLIDKVFRITIDQFAFAGGLVLMITGIRAMVGGGSPGGRKRATPPPAGTRRSRWPSRPSPCRCWSGPEASSTSCSSRSTTGESSRCWPAWQPSCSSS
ncbi:MAG TPA: hypothetical protein DCX07_01130 [Phycisphaerales bacterium]|nr:hypothetical protein [Phycisphaerales bacterium]